MSQARFKVAQVNPALMVQVEANPATHYCLAMTFQLGCSIGELIAMGVPPDELLATIDKLVEHAVKTRLSVNTNPEDKG